MMLAVVFAAGFAWAASLGLGGFAKEPAMSPRDYYYFALLTVRTVGLSDLYPTDHLGVSTIIASLMVFIMISCTAGYGYKKMSPKED
ncbi:ion channel [Alteriqipengyuania flavescens]|uniref:ion channel n=1 Tax=Alteriqipengyuania flavescens TaxID=3053610 RepID=UPI0025B3B376|nr:ion channel [Alteriqipengyuania flavescens]WJY19888.1 ion channel [Alteriqipengyuania flavescens]WJY25830.1 ion channel [Alteriqipengyuania flavescens]